jgi:oligoribonuclease NrnB/cAMP/cGMP phosphodiesterase (DHH superfamily)
MIGASVMVTDLTKPEIMILHTDLDGIGPEVVYRVLMDTAPEAYYVDNAILDITIRSLLTMGELDGRTVYICDHSPTLDTYSLLIERGVDVYVFDHHASSQLKDMMSDRVYIEIGTCATKIFYDYMVDTLASAVVNPLLIEALGDFVTLVDDWDTWKHKHPKSAQLNTLFYALGRPYFVNRFTTRMELTFDAAEQAAIDTFELNRDRYVASLQDTMIIMTDENGYRYGYVTAERYDWVSKAFNQLIVDNNLDYVIGLNMLTRTGSIRAKATSSINSLDVIKRIETKLTPLLSSGGHKDSAGFSFTPLGGVIIHSFFTKGEDVF